MRCRGLNLPSRSLGAISAEWLFSLLLFFRVVVVVVFFAIHFSLYYLGNVSLFNYTFSKTAAFTLDLRKFTRIGFGRSSQGL